jgi:hypothetical protein
MRGRRIAGMGPAVTLSSTTVVSSTFTAPNVTQCAILGFSVTVTQPTATPRITLMWACARRYEVTMIARLLLASALSAALISQADAALNTRESPLSATEYGAIGDGANDDTTSLQDGLNAAGASVNGSIGGDFYVPKGVYVVSSSLCIPNWVHMYGAGPNATTIIAKSTFSGNAIITNCTQTGLQEFVGLSNMTVTAQTGATVLDAGVEFVGIFANSYIENNIILSVPANGLHILVSTSETAQGGAGPVIIKNNWVLHSATDNILIENIDTTGSFGFPYNMGLYGNTTEHAGVGHADLHIKAAISPSGNPAFNIGVWGHHVEQTSFGANTYGVLIDGCDNCIIDNLFVSANGWTTANTFTPLAITSNADNLNIQVRNFTNDTGVEPAFVDSKNSFTLGGSSTVFYMPWYVTPDATLRSGTGAAVTCSGSPTSSFAATNGIVTHC